MSKENKSTNNLTNINSQIANLNLEELKIAVEQQNNGLITSMYNAIMSLQDIVIKQQKEIVNLQGNTMRIVSLMEKITAKIEILHQFMKSVRKDKEDKGE